MRPILKTIHDNRKGYTFIEVLVAITVTAVIVVAISSGIFQMFTVSALSHHRMEAVKQVENAVHWINRDAQMAQANEIKSDNGSTYPRLFPLILRWTDYPAPDYNAVNYVVTYTINGTSLERRESINSEDPEVTEIAEYIDAAASNFKFGSQILTVELTADTGGFRPAAETRTLEVKPRSMQ